MGVILILKITRKDLKRKNGEGLILEDQGQELSEDQNQGPGDLGLGREIGVLDRKTDDLDQETDDLDQETDGPNRGTDDLDRGTEDPAREIEEIDPEEEGHHLEPEDQDPEIDDLDLGLVDPDPEIKDQLDHHLKTMRHLIIGILLGALVKKTCPNHLLETIRLY